MIDEAMYLRSIHGLSRRNRGSALHGFCAFDVALTTLWHLDHDLDVVDTDLRAQNSMTAGMSPMTSYLTS